MKPTFSPLLTSAMHQVLVDLSENNGLDILSDVGRVAYCGNRPIAKRTLYALLRLCLLHENYEGGSILYTLNEDGRKILRDPEYRPRILAFLGEGEPKVTRADFAACSRETTRRRTPPRRA
jgi:hypothetical protein